MGKVLDSREVEYCYLDELVLRPHVKKIEDKADFQKVTYGAEVALVYGLKDGEKEPLSRKATVLKLVENLETPLTKAEFLQLFISKKMELSVQIAADKLYYTGYQSE